MNILKTFPRLYGKATNGKIKTILYTVEQLDDGSCDIVNEHGYIDGKKQYDRRNISKGKNIGKANETTIAQQALSEAQSKWNAKKDSNYTENESGEPDMAEKSLLPMLAHKFKERKHNIKYPCLIQPKIDGVRCLARPMGNGKFKYTSRKDKPYEVLSFLDKQLYELFGDDCPILDGEIYIHGLSLQEINRRVKKDRGEDTSLLEFWIFDTLDVQHDNQYRIDYLTRRFSITPTQPNIKFVPCYKANSEEDVYRFHSQYVADGFEGAIIRNTNGMYLPEKRSADLQKYKEFDDDEFKIVGAFSGEGRESGAIVFTCEVKEPKGVKTFDVRPRGSIESRIKMMAESKSFIGKDLTVRHQGYTEDNVPVFPVGITIRDYE